MEILNSIEEQDKEPIIEIELTEEEIELILEATNHKFDIEEAIVHILEEALVDIKL